MSTEVLATILKFDTEIDAGYDEIQLDCLQISSEFNNLEFIRDFGPWKKGDKIGCFCLNFEAMTATEYALDGAATVVKQCSIKVDAI